VASEVDNIIDGLPAHWERTTLGTICERGGGLVQTGPFGSQLHAADYVAVGIPSIMPVNIDNFRVTEQGIERVAPADAERLSRHLVRPGDIVFSRRGDVERHALIRESERGWMCGTGCVLVRMGDKWKHDETPVLPEFASYWLRHPDVRGWIVAHAVGSTMPNLNTSIMAAIPFVVPPLPEQRAIARVLGGLDDKIELNRRMNKTLEDLARGVFRSWFVDFDPVTKPSRGFAGNGHGRAPATPAGLFPKRLVDSPIGPIPEGWRVSKVGEHMVNFDSKRVPVSGGDRAKRQGKYPYYGAASVMDYVDGYLFDGIYLLVGEDGSVIQPSGLAVTQYVWGKIWVNNHAHVLQGKGSVCTEQLWAYFQHEDVGGIVTGAVQPKITQGNMNNLPFLYPGEAVCREFARTVAPWFARLRANTEETRTLAALRDALLPQLLSGEIRLRDAEAAVGDSLHAVGTPRRGDGSTHPRTGKVAGSARGKA